MLVLRSPIWPALLVLAVLVLLPLGRSSELPLACAGVAALVLLAQRRIDLRDSAPRLAPTLFACYWLPALLSGFAAIEPGKTWSTVAVALRFLPFALFAVWALRDSATWSALTKAVAVI